ncbi:MAG TPA: hypothetical protein VF068_06855 [Rubrobacter sp.]
MRRSGWSIGGAKIEDRGNVATGSKSAPESPLANYDPATTGH